MQVTPESPVEIIKGVNDCFFESEDHCHHVEGEVGKCPNVVCKLYKPQNPMDKRDN